MLVSNGIRDEISSGKYEQRDQQYDVRNYSLFTLVNLLKILHELSLNCPGFYILQALRCKGAISELTTALLK